MSGPLLFLIYIKNNDWDLLCKFARDTKICHAVITEEEVQILRDDFKNLAKQSTEWRVCGRSGGGICGRIDDGFASGEAYGFTGGRGTSLMAGRGTGLHTRPPNNLPANSPARQPASPPTHDRSTAHQPRPQTHPPDNLPGRKSARP